MMNGRRERENRRVAAVPGTEKKKHQTLSTHELAAMTKRVWFAVRTSQFTPENQSGKLFTHFSD
jgi:hypothetical protein